MTAYFDRFAKDLRDLGPDVEGRADELAALEERLVRDVFLATRLPRFPEAARAGVYRAVAQFAVQTLPSRGFPRPDFEFDEQYRGRLERMGDELHTIFHGVARLEIEGVSDDPLSLERAAMDDAWDEAAAAGLGDRDEA